MTVLALYRAEAAPGSERRVATIVSRRRSPWLEGEEELRPLVSEAAPSAVLRWLAPGLWLKLLASRFRGPGLLAVIEGEPRGLQRLSRGERRASERVPRVPWAEPGQPAGPGGGAGAGGAPPAVEAAPARRRW